MMNENNINAFYSKISREYEAFDSLQIGDKIVELGDILAGLGKQLINQNSTEEMHIVLTYYSNNIDIEIDRFRIRRDGKWYPAHFLRLNILTIEFLSDLLLLKKYPDKDHCIYLFSKYRRNVENAAGHLDHAAYYNKIYAHFQYRPTFEWWQNVPLASNGMYFLLFHEWAHTQKQLVSETVELFQKFQEVIPSWNSFFDASILDQDKVKGELEEIACDFIALSILDRSLKESESSINPVSVALYALTCIPLYSVILSFYHTQDYQNFDEMFSNFDKSLDDLLDRRFQERFRNLATVLAVTQYGRNFFAGVDMERIGKDILDIISCFFKNIAAFWEDELIPGFNTFSSLDIEERKKYYLNKADSPFIKIY